ncbi:ubiquitin carboxyl-terminal hydrolase-related protein [Actinidia rufa]|uniref:Ubiquitin carboxyl-terminal hydrolase-related protein n=1 Tax=Actinidia rufa TaxID=165716 RepID=A0A7J0H1Y8_9ERIC|nr:ubiquitin carboxyl-terminal hydrolase-related protein [Actinidia rufa]
MLISSFQARLEDLAEKYATEKSDAAREAFLAELALDTRKGSGGGRLIISYLLQATGKNELMLHHETAEGVSSPVASNGDHPYSEIAVSRRIEDEAKQKYLAQLHKKAKRTIPEKHSDDDQDETLTQKNGFPNGLECEPVNTTDKAAQRTGNTTAHNHTKVKQGLPNGIPEDFILSNDRRTGRKGRRQKSSAKLLGTNYQTLSSEKKNIEVGQVRVRDGLHGDSILDLGLWLSERVVGIKAIIGNCTQHNLMNMITLQSLMITPPVSWLESYISHNQPQAERKDEDSDR